MLPRHSRHPSLLPLSHKIACAPIMYHSASAQSSKLKGIYRSSPSFACRTCISAWLQLQTSLSRQYLSHGLCSFGFRGHPKIVLVHVELRSSSHVNVTDHYSSERLPKPLKAVHNPIRESNSRSTMTRKPGSIACDNRVALSKPGVVQPGGATDRPRRR
jgi:hypothetical protein